MRQLTQLVNAHPTNDGDGVKIRRLAGRHLNVAMDPFLLLDEIKSDDAADYIGGFPEHPHRGFETITYMKAGRMRHRDHMGNEGVIEAGDSQWMTAGRGVLHSEMPEQQSGLLHGFQFWLNLPASEKMQPAAYKDVRNKDINELHLDNGANIRLIAGSAVIDNKQLESSLPVRSTQPVLIDVALPANTSVEIAIDKQLSIMAYVYAGETDQIRQGQMGIYSEGDRLNIETTDQAAQLLVFGGRAIKEPIAQYGPFVMNNHEEIETAIQDFQFGRLAS